MSENREGLFGFYGGEGRLLWLICEGGGAGEEAGSGIVRGDWKEAKKILEKGVRRPRVSKKKKEKKMLIKGAGVGREFVFREDGVFGWLKRKKKKMALERVVSCVLAG